MDSIVITALPRKFSNGYLLVPATAADKKTLDLMCEKAGGKAVKLSAHVIKTRKSFDQVKAVFALIDIIFQCDHARKPTGHEKALYYTYLLNEYGERCMVSVSGSEPSWQAIGLSSMTKAQAARFISALMAHVCQLCDLPEHLASEVSTLVETFTAYRGLMDEDEVDKGVDGKYLSVQEWIRRNNYSHATGKTERLEIAHIVSKGTAPQFRDCVWNFLRLTHDEHMEQHTRGWDHMFRLYPHIKGRVERAREMAGKLELQSTGDLAVQILEDIF